MAKFKIYDSGELIGEMEADERAANRAAVKMVANGFTIEWVTRTCHCCGGAGRVAVVGADLACGNCSGTGRER